LAHEDDVKILRWKEKFDQIPENTKDPTLMRAKKELKRKKPSRRETVTYWSEAQFTQLKGAPPGKLYSKGPLVIAYQGRLHLFGCAFAAALVAQFNQLFWFALTG
jgi:hypothetical protein